MEITVMAIYTNTGRYTRHLFATTADLGEDEGTTQLEAEFVQICKQIGIARAAHNHTIASEKQAAEAILM